MPVISIILPTYKPGCYITHCLRSIELQTIDKSLFKVYIALNGSDISFKRFLEEEIKKYTFQCELYFLEQPGVSNARNFLIEQSTEDFIVFVDDDDIISENYLEELLKVSTSTTIGISNTYDFIDNIKNLKSNFIGISFDKLEEVTISKTRARKYFSSPWAKMIHRNIIGDVRFDTRLSIGEDSLFMAHLSPKVEAVKKTKKTACYYVNERQGSATRKKVNRKKELSRVLYLLKEYGKMLLDSQYDRVFVMSRIVATLFHLKKVFNG